MDKKGDIWLVIGVIVFFLALALIAYAAIKSDLAKEFAKRIGMGEIPTADSERESTCQEDDGGKNFFTVGTLIMGGTNPIEDFCNSTSGILEERFCEGEFNSTEEYLCPLGCDGNACKTGVYTLADCTDNDGGQNFFNIGITTNSSGSYYDECIEIKGLKRILKEYFCNKDKDGKVTVDYTVYECLKKCLDNACII